MWRRTESAQDPGHVTKPSQDQQSHLAAHRNMYELYWTQLKWLDTLSWPIDLWSKIIVCYHMPLRFYCLLCSVMVADDSSYNCTDIANEGGCFEQRALSNSGWQSWLPGWPCHLSTSLPEEDRFPSLGVLSFRPDSFLPGLSNISRIQFRKQGFFWQLVRIIEMWVEAH